MKLTTALAAILLTTTATAAWAAPSTQEFVTKASVGGMFEVESSKLALSRSSNADVKKFAQQMIADHSKANAALKATLAKSKTDAKPAAALDADHQKIIADLKAADKEDFDADYLDAQETAHEKTVALFESYASSGDNADVKKFASDTLPTLKKHKEHVEALDDKDVGDNL